jgi:hypothetical protein
MTTESPWDDDPGYYGLDDFGENHYEKEYYGPEERGPHSLDAECTECEHPVDPGRDICRDCEREKAELEANPDAYKPVHDEIAVAYDKHIEDLAFAVIPARSRFEAIVKATLAFDQRETAPDTPAGYDGLSFELLHDADDSDIRSFTIGWGALPEAVPVASERGLELFNKAHNRTDWLDPFPEGAEEHLSIDSDIYLYDEDGTAISRARQLVDLIDEYDVPEDPRDYTCPEYGSDEDELWLVPAFVFRIHPTTTT